ncbi:Fic family protein [Brachybacterium sp. Marseille-Q2903]|uniref:Fic family protein n=1 Tax=Brachybacterium epidermidis TaxID=2781983 RepID=A0ABR9W3J5_9MICO|nr:Fic family protein [Brachybacterium epidermidis]MBE9403873.1 Fic family protein [Brachybacterium epidermidis]
MKSFTPLERTLGAVPGTLVGDLRSIDIGRGREELYANQLPELLTALAARARVQSITASSALEGVLVPDKARAARIIDGSARGLRTRSEQEFAGYRAALDYLFADDWRPLNLGLILHLHRLLFSETPGKGGTLKTSDNLVVDRNEVDSRSIRFTPVPAAYTAQYLDDLLNGYLEARSADAHHPVLLIGLLILDLLTIHPFDDGNGRVARVLTNALLAEAGYGIGRYVSLEQLIAESADDYYACLLESTHGWHDNEHDVWPWLRYFVSLLTKAYRRFEEGAASDRSTGSKQDRVREFVLDHAPEFFAIGDVRAALPGVSDQTIRLVLDALRKDGRIRSEGTGRGARWHRLGGT